VVGSADEAVDCATARPKIGREQIEGVEFLLGEDETAPGLGIVWEVAPRIREQLGDRGAARAVR